MPAFRTSGRLAVLRGTTRPRPARRPRRPGSSPAAVPHDPEECAALFGQDHAQTGRMMALRIGAVDPKLRQPIRGDGMWQERLNEFLTLFIVVNPISTLPVFLAITA